MNRFEHEKKLISLQYSISNLLMWLESDFAYLPGEVYWKLEKSIFNEFKKAIEGEKVNLISSW